MHLANGQRQSPTSLASGQCGFELFNICMGNQRQRCEHNPPTYIYIYTYLYIDQLEVSHETETKMMRFKIGKSDFKMTSRFQASILTKQAVLVSHFKKRSAKIWVLDPQTIHKHRESFKDWLELSATFFGTSNFETETDLQSIGRIQGVERVATLVHEMYPNVSIPWWFEFH